MTSGEYGTSKEEFAKAFVLDIKRSEKCFQIGLVLEKNKIKKEPFLSPSVF
jgi:hypothetical protein